MVLNFQVYDKIVVFELIVSQIFRKFFFDFFRGNSDLIKVSVCCCVVFSVIFSTIISPVNEYNCVN